jgi:murein DD-endopeptidase MepM/ murein hydrolase activator NlpD
MGKSKYYYNPETCQYERASLTFSSVLFYGTGLIAAASLIFVGLLMLADRLVETKKEKFLTAENDALKKHKIVLASRLSEVESGIDKLHQKDRMIYEKLFEVKPEATQPQTNTMPDHSFLLADAGEFRDKLDNLKETTKELRLKSFLVNQAFGNHFSLKAEDAGRLQSVPTLQPIGNSNLDFVVSGFGIRINPFHKGKYMHPGIDFAAPRGTGVTSTAPGKVIEVKKSSLQAGYGNYVEIDHGNGFVTRYSHLEGITVRIGEKVAKGQAIGTVGNSGGSIAPHLHYEVIRNKETVDPLIYMVEGLNSQDYNRLTSICGTQNQSLD